MAGKLLKWLLITLLLLPCAANAAAPYLDPDSAAAQCLADLQECVQEDAAICTDEAGHLLMSFSEGEAFAAVRMGDAVALAYFCQEDGEWFMAWINMHHPFGVDENSADRQPDYLHFNGDTLTWFVTGADETLEVTATYNDWDWLVTGLTRHILVDGTWQLTEQREEPIAMLEGFSLHQENEPEPVVIEGNKLVHYPESRMDAHYTVPDGIEIIGEYAFSDNEWLVRVTLPESVRVIEDAAFAYCQNLRVVDMPSTLESLGENAFDCTYVQQASIPDGLTALPAHAFAAADLQGTVVIPEGVTDIGAECFVFNAGITDMYLPASLQTIAGETFRQGAEFWYIWGFNSIDEGETHMTVHAPAGTEAARFAMWSGEAYVIEDAREGTDLPAVTGWVQAVLDTELPGAKVSENEYGFPCVTYSADTVLAYAVRPKSTRYGADEHFLCCFDRTGNELTLRWVNADSGMTIPLEMTLIGDRLTLMLRLGEETAAALTFSGEDFRLTETSTCVWVKDLGGPPPCWSTMLAVPVKDGAPLQTFITREYAPREQVVQGAVFDGDAVLLPLLEVVGYAEVYINEESLTTMRFEIGDTQYVLDEEAMTLTVEGDADPFNLILPAPGSTDFRSEIIDGRWMVDADTVYCTFRSILGWPIRIHVDDDTQTVTVCREE